jgi:Protein of unknown function (DUF3551)
MQYTAALTVLAIAYVLSAIPASAQDRYCLQGRQWGYPGNCAFATYAQCMATASGTESACGINPRYAYARHHYRGYRSAW